MNEAMNRDIRPPVNTLVVAGDLACLVDTPDIAAEFDRYEKAAKSWKRRYTVAGVTGLSTSFLGMVLLGVQYTMPHLLAGSTTAAFCGLVLAVAGLFTTIFFLVAKPRKRWLFARFGAEWMRCLKFRLYLAVGAAEDGAALKALVTLRTATALQRFRYRMLGGYAAMRFSPGEVIRDARATAAVVVPPARLEAVKELYRDMRIGVQLQHFEARKDDKESELRPARSAGDLFFLAALLLTLAQIGVDGVHLLLPGGGAVQPSTGTAALTALGSWTLYAASATLLIWERGRGAALDRDRYSRYHAEIEQAAMSLHDADLPSFMAIVANVEELCLWELQDFCRDNERGSYLG